MKRRFRQVSRKYTGRINVDKWPFAGSERRQNHFCWPASCSLIFRALQRLVPFKFYELNNVPCIFVGDLNKPNQSNTTLLERSSSSSYIVIDWRRGLCQKAQSLSVESTAHNFCESYTMGTRKVLIFWKSETGWGSCHKEALFHFPFQLVSWKTRARPLLSLHVPQTKTTLYTIHKKDLYLLIFEVDERDTQQTHNNRRVFT